MKIILFDLETNGLPKQPNFHKYYHYSQLQYYSTSRIIQIGMLVFTDEGSKHIEKDHKELNAISGKQNFKLIREYNLLIKPVNYKIANEHIHGISHKTAEEHGIEFKKAVTIIRDEFKDANLIVAHNLAFDRNVLASELFRSGLSEEVNDLTNIPGFCTSIGCTTITKIRYNAQEYKQPKLKELYKYLFGCEPTGLHDALQDTKVLSMCFFELLNKGKIAFEFK